MPATFVPLTSSNLKGCSYDSSSKDLTVHFHNGGVWTYQNVPQEHYDQLVKDSSPGKYFHSHIKTVYPSTKA